MTITITNLIIASDEKVEIVSTYECVILPYRCTVIPIRDLIFYFFHQSVHCTSQKRLQPSNFGSRLVTWSNYAPYWHLQGFAGWVLWPFQEKKYKVWRAIANSFEALGHAVDGLACDQKMWTLKRMYIHIECTMLRRLWPLLFSQVSTYAYFASMRSPTWTFTKAHEVSYPS